jgi:hypothetical protein
MKSPTALREESMVNAVAALVGVAAAVAIRLWLTPDRARSAPRSDPKRRQLMRRAAQDPLYLADLREVHDDFAYADAEQL